MSASAALQIALIAALEADAAVTGFLGQRIWDNAPDNAPYPHISLGPAQELDDSADCIDGAECFQQIDVWTDEEGSQLSVKQICGAVRKALHGAELVLAHPYALASIEVDDLRVIGNPDGKLAHGIVVLRAELESSDDS